MSRAEQRHVSQNPQKWFPAFGLFVEEIFVFACSGQQIFNKPSDLSSDVRFRAHALTCHPSHRKSTSRHARQSLPHSVTEPREFLTW